MKTKSIAFVALLLAAGLATGVVGGAAGAATTSDLEALEFAGYYRSGSETRFVLAEPAAGRRSEWLGVGEAYAGFMVADFDARAEILFVERDGMRLALRLKSAGGGSGETARRVAADAPQRTAPANVVEGWSLPASSVQTRYASGMTLLKGVQQDVQRAVVMRQRGAMPAVASDRQRAEDQARAREQALAARLRAASGRVDRTRVLTSTEQGTSNAVPPSGATTRQ